MRVEDVCSSPNTRASFMLMRHTRPSALTSICSSAAAECTARRSSSHRALTQPAADTGAGAALPSHEGRAGVAEPPGSAFAAATNDAEVEHAMAPSGAAVETVTHESMTCCDVASEWLPAVLASGETVSPRSSCCQSTSEKNACAINASAPTASGRHAPSRKPGLGCSNRVIRSRAEAEMRSSSSDMSAHAASSSEGETPSSGLPTAAACELPALSGAALDAQLAIADSGGATKLAACEGCTTALCSSARSSISDSSIVMLPERVGCLPASNSKSKTPVDHQSMAKP
mmetsp:Transcript_10568/g.24483  ORF Transcript_10568/g.24483 Transcript_10568/m.24483 type:complete len:287 (-) Transcript_10568:626-1486(-)